MTARRARRKAMAGTVLYDGDCAVCTRIAKRWAQVDQGAHGSDRFAWLPNQDPSAQALIRRHDLHDVVPRTLVLVRDHQVFVRSGAVWRILWDLPRKYRCYGALLVMVPWPVRELGYRIIARNRWLLAPFFRGRRR